MTDTIKKKYFAIFWNFTRNLQVKTDVEKCCDMMFKNCGTLYSVLIGWL
jgi:hypothetical protein